jgi:hypothetical protein
MSRHVKRKHGRLLMRFTGKHGIVHEVPLSDSRLARVVKRCQELPGQMLFQYLNGDGEPQGVNSADVMTTSARRRAEISPPSISAPGAPASSPSINYWRRRTTPASASPPSSSQSPKRSATPRP